MTWFTVPDDVDRAIDWIRNEVPARPLGVVNYDAVLAGAGLPSTQEVTTPELSRFMRHIHDRCIGQNWPPFDSVVVSKNSDWALPGRGYWTANGVQDLTTNMDGPAAQEAMDLWKAQQREVWNALGHPNATR